MSDDLSDLIGVQPAVAMPVATRPRQTREEFCHQVTEETAETVRTYAQVGCPYDLIARRLDISVDTLQRNYKETLETAETQLIVAVKNCLAKKAMEGDVVAMLKLLGAKSRKYSWIGFGPDAGEQAGTTINLQIDAAQAISSMFAELKRGSVAPPAHARIIEQAPKDD